MKLLHVFQKVFRPKLMHFKSNVHLNSQICQYFLFLNDNSRYQNNPKISNCLLGCGERANQNDIKMFINDLLMHFIHFAIIDGLRLSTCLQLLSLNGYIFERL